MNNYSLTQMDLTKWFRHIEYMVGILNSIGDKNRANDLNKSLIRSCQMFIKMSNEYFNVVDSDDVEVMMNRVKIILDNLHNKMKSNYLLPLIDDAFEQITFDELEKWKQHIMYMVGVMMSTPLDYHKIFGERIRQDIKILFLYSLAYYNKLDEEEREENDVKALMLQIINIYNNIKQK
jgi:hypothetical protein